jgi:hypothetical protein
VSGDATEDLTVLHTSPKSSMNALKFITSSFQVQETSDNVEIFQSATPPSLLTNLTHNYLVLLPPTPVTLCSMKQFEIKMTN